MMELILMRHTSVAVDASLVYGRTDVDVASSFPAEAEAARARLSVIWPEGPTIIISSPAQRCQRLAQHLGTVDRVDERLWEMGFGAWELQRWDALPRDELDAWSHDFVLVHPPGGESYGELALRVHHALREIVESTRQSANSDERVLVVAHGGVIRAALAHYLEIPLRRSFDVQIDYASITMVGWRASTPHVKLINHR